ncbi:hypothetical protein TREMEDRAFT_63344 [Tremella mesenterica DSM 1558]|uniref:uncharacterized protein n=1 Tax=Tremella mesenterica (strain ATCC 24925 / CBS 8224 / DSM 1558 / NBRC 9311 / NRRL Y-6157 / RJB 2259-6 / UBC 559-6) TaxID=578456 RepID=UPI0003F49A8F|nr:uncharacterized protein TREMEDRAFT_63344 [Tremella mesenterica DSM 1558]EIW68175.1 hypothetical protein TREMEDRAFT_63344 [Tremella mesenterica DSM 1558]
MSLSNNLSKSPHQQWIWVQGIDREAEDPDRTKQYGGALAEATSIMNSLMDNLMELERGPKGKRKAPRDQVSLRSGWTVGKWLLFPKPHEIDKVWSVVASSVAHGPLRDAGVFLSKVAPKNTHNLESSHLICLYIHDVYDLIAVRKVLETLIRHHGLEPTAVKSDLYTLAGIDSNHPTKLRSSIWRPYEVLPGGKTEVEALKEEFLSISSSGGSHQGSGGIPKRARDQGLIDTDSEEERIVRRHKTNANVDSRPTQQPLLFKRAENAKIVKPKSKLAGLKFREENIFAGSDND